MHNARPTAVRIRTHLAAAALLLVPLAATLATTAATAQPRGVAAEVRAAAIERFVVRSNGRIAPGRELRFRVVGIPRGEAWVDIPGVIHGIDLDETRPGVYEGSYTVRRRDDLQSFDRAVATLEKNRQRASARVNLEDDRRDDRRDDRAPVISDLTPAQGDRVDRHGRISAHISDEGSGIDPASIRLVVNGRDVTRDTRVDGNELQFRGFLERGRHTAELVVSDRAGNTSRRSWSFEVGGRG
jgi:hypothetical protein